MNSATTAAVVWDSHLCGLVGLVSQADEGLQLPVQPLPGGRFAGSVGAQLVAPEFLPGALGPENVLAVCGLGVAGVAGRHRRLPGSPGAAHAGDEGGTAGRGSLRATSGSALSFAAFVSPQNCVLLIPAVEQVVVAAARSQLGTHWLVSARPKHRRTSCRSLRRHNPEPTAPRSQPSHTQS